MRRPAGAAHGRARGVRRPGRAGRRPGRQAALRGRSRGPLTAGPRRVAVVGVGLVGGSVGLAARERLGAHVVGLDAPDVLERAVACGAIDAPAPADGPLDVDLAVVAVPVAALAGAVAEVLRRVGPDAVVTDVGSTKAAVVAATDDPRFIGGHPLAGGERAGVEHARADLFAGAVWYVTPRPGTVAERLMALTRFVTGLGAVPSALDAAAHDRLMAAVSHLPHVVANVLVAQAAAALGGERMPPTGPSFRDATRVAGAHPPLWREIYAANREALLEQLDGAIAGLRAARDELAAGGDLLALQERAAAQRHALVETDFAGGRLQEVAAVVPNRPGVVADLALALGREAINIHDMSLSPSADASTGRVAIWVGEQDAARAQQLVDEALRP